jgi:hypothetical protein
MVAFIFLYYDTSVAKFDVNTIHDGGVITDFQ